jgi:hypothetical protein
MLGKRVQVFVCDEPHTVTVSHWFKARWVAHGRYLGKSITVEDQTEAAVLQRWRATAEATALLTSS